MVKKNTKNKKTCHGCAHEASEDCRIRNVHIPSGESACISCIRNPYIPDIRKDNFITLENFIKKEDDVVRGEYEKVEFD